MLRPLLQDARVGKLSVCAPAAQGSGEGVTAVRFDPSGMHVACGDSEGIVRLYDLRSSRPTQEKDHMYGCPIVDVRYHTGADGSRRVISTDTRVVKIWDPTTGSNYTSVEPGVEINDVCVWDGTGLMVAALERRALGCYFAPSLGAAPRWCSFLENLTEEMEEEQRPGMYDDYRFVTREELDRLGMSHLVGTNMLRAYMHGFFVDNRLYGKAKAIAEPFSYEQYRAQKVEEARGARATRITVKKKLPKVNAALVARLEADGAKTRSAAGSKAQIEEESDGEQRRRRGPSQGRTFRRHVQGPRLRGGRGQRDVPRAPGPNAPKSAARARGGAGGPNAAGPPTTTPPGSPAPAAAAAAAAAARGGGEGGGGGVKGSSSHVRWPRSRACSCRSSRALPACWRPAAWGGRRARRPTCCFGAGAARRALPLGEQADLRRGLAGWLAAVRAARETAAEDAAALAAAVRGADESASWGKPATATRRRAGAVRNRAADGAGEGDALRLTG